VARKTASDDKLQVAWRLSESTCQDCDDRSSNLTQRAVKVVDVLENIFVEAAVLGISTVSALVLGQLVLKGLSQVLFSKRQR